MSNIIVIVFSMEGCGACEAYAPTFQRVAASRPDVRSYVYDCNDQRPEVQQLVERFKISSTPTTLVLRRGPGEIREEGELEEAELRALFDVRG